jgi:hypothetical protein
MDSAGGGQDKSDSTQEVLNDLRRAATHIGDRILTKTDYEEYGRFDVATVTERFPGWHFALHKAGLIDEETVSDWDAERYDLIADVRRVAEGVDGDLTLNTYMNRGEYSQRTVKKHLGDGSWPETLKAADLSGYGHDGNDPSPPEGQATLSDVEEMGAGEAATGQPASGLTETEQDPSDGDVLDEMSSPADRTLFEQVEDYQSDSGCPTCGEPYSSLGLHWAQSSTCDYPALSATQLEALRGVLLRHGSIEAAGDKARVKLRTNKPGLALWLADLFGPLTARLEVVEREVDGLDTDGWEESRSAAFATINHPELVTMRRRWEGGVPLDYAVTSSPTRLAVLYALAGWVDSRGSACLPMGGAGLSEQSMRRLGAGFDASIRDHQDGPVLALGAREQFGQRLAAGAVPLPLAGAEEKFNALGIGSDSGAEDE